MQFDADSVQLCATITELVERMRQAAYDEGYADARSIHIPGTMSPHHGSPWMRQPPIGQSV